MEKKNYCSVISMILKYLTHSMCKADVHTQKKAYVCKKHTPLLYNCKLCKLKSKKAKFTYKCKVCHQFFCLVHFTEHDQVFKQCMCHKLDIACNTDLIKITPKLIEFLKKGDFHQIAVHLGIQSIPVKIAMGLTKYDASILSTFVKEKKVQTLSICSKRSICWGFS